MNRHNQTASAAHAQTAISAYFAELGRRGGERKASTARDNGTQGGRPPLFANFIGPLGEPGHRGAERDGA